MVQIIDANNIKLKTDQQAITVAWFNNWVDQFCTALNGVGVRMDGYDAAEANLVNLGLANINSVLGPFLTTLQQAAQLGFLVAEADGRPLALQIGQPFDMILTSTGASLFTPTHWLMVMDVNDSTNWGVLSLDSWVAADLNLAAHCIYASKTQTSSSWQVTCGSGILNAMINDMNVATAAAASAQSAATTASQGAATVTAALGSIGAAGVQSINGKAGFISLLAEADVANLVSDLANRPTNTSVTTQLAGKQPLSTALTNLAALTFSSFVLAFLGAPDATSALTTLGAVSATSPAFTGAPTAPTQTAGDNSTRLATTQFVGAAIAAAAIPVKASASDIATGTDDTKFATAAGIASAYSSKTLQWSAAQAAGFTLGATFNGQAIPWTAAGAGTITLANIAPAGTECMISCEGAGQITFAAQSGGSVQSRGARFKSNGQYSMITALVVTNTGTNAAWRLGGDLTT